MGIFANNRSKTKLSRRRLTALAAAFALIVQIILPLGQVLAFDGGQGVDYQAICLPKGFTFAPVERDDAPVTPTYAVPCPLCTLQLAPALPAPQDIALIVIDAPAQHAAYGLPLQHARTSIWRDTLQPSRAPPFSV